MNLFVSLKYLVALSDHRHFGRAALACHVTQPALSNALKALEDGFGTPIIKRGRNFAGLTTEGERILVSARRIRLRVISQYTERYFLLRKALRCDSKTLKIGPAITWSEAAELSLCLLSSEMHNRTIIDRAFVTAGAHPSPAIETNSILTLALSVVAGRVCSVMPGALVSAVKGHPELEALPLMSPQVEVPIAFMLHDTNRPSRTLEAALAFAQDETWLLHVAEHAGMLGI